MMMPGEMIGAELLTRYRPASTAARVNASVLAAGLYAPRHGCPQCSLGRSPRCLLHRPRARRAVAAAVVRNAADQLAHRAARRADARLTSTRRLLAPCDVAAHIVPLHPVPFVVLLPYYGMCRVCKRACSSSILQVAVLSLVPCARVLDVHTERNVRVH